MRLFAAACLVILMLLDAGAQELWAGRHLFISVGGTSLRADERALLSEIRPGGVVLLGPNVRDAAQVSALVTEIKTAAGMGAGLADLPLIAADQEGGRINRLKLAPAPAARELGDSGDPALAEETGRAFGAASRALGVAVLLAPVLDVYEPGATGVIGSRAFGEESSLVSRMGLAFARGVMDVGAIPVAKHFPGHGPVRQDSHHKLAVLDKEGLALQVHLGPFMDAAVWGIPGIMVGHIACPALAPEHPDRPASLSPELVAGLLRRGMDYQQVVITDDMSMGAIGLSKPEACVQALAAGCDAVIVFGSVAEMRAVCAAIDAAIGNGRLSREQLATSAARLDAWSAHVREFPKP
jgi:beta-N-acetylhexosaminidase